MRCQVQVQETSTHRYDHAASFPIPSRLVVLQYYYIKLGSGKGIIYCDRTTESPLESVI